MNTPLRAPGHIYKMKQSTFLCNEHELPESRPVLQLVERWHWINRCHYFWSTRTTEFWNATTSRAGFDTKSIEADSLIRPYRFQSIYGQVWCPQLRPSSMGILTFSYPPWPYVGADKISLAFANFLSSHLYPQLSEICSWHQRNDLVPKFWNVDFLTSW